MACRCPLWVWTVGGSVSFLLILGFVLFGVLYSFIISDQTLFYNQLGQAILLGIKTSADHITSNLLVSAQSVYYSEPLISGCSMPNTGYDPERLVKLFNSLSTDPTRELSSIGIIRYDSGTPDGKISWELASGFGCPEYIYGFDDPASYPAYLGYCTFTNSTVDWARVAYNGTDWGLKAQERYLLISNTTIGTVIHLPIFALLDQLTLTVEQSVGCLGGVYGAVFAEQSLSQTDEALATMTTSSILPGAVAFIVELSSGYLVSSSIPNQTQIPDPTSPGNALRVLANSTPSPDIQTIYSSYLTGAQPADWWVLGENYISEDLQWVLVVGLPATGFVQAIRGISGLAIGVGLGIIVVMLVLAVLFTVFCVARPLKQMVELGNPDYGKGPIQIDELVVLSEALG